MVGLRQEDFQFEVSLGYIEKLSQTNKFLDLKMKVCLCCYLFPLAWPLWDTHQSLEQTNHALCPFLMLSDGTVQASVTLCLLATRHVPMTPLPSHNIQWPSSIYRLIANC